MSHKKKYTREFRQEAIKLVIEQGYSQAEASKRLGIPNANLSRWVKESIVSNTIGSAYRNTENLA